MENFFLPIPGYENRYQISPCGIVKTISRVFRDKRDRLQKVKEQLIKTSIDKRSGYPVVKLTKPDGSYGTQYLHRLVAKAHVPNPFDKPCVNHKDGNKLNCCADNFEWVTRSENQIHALENNLAKIPTENRVPVIDVCTGKLYDSMADAAKDTGYPYWEIKGVLAGRRDDCPCLRRAA